MLQRTPVVIRADLAARHPAILTNRRTATGADESPPLDPSGIAVLNKDGRRVSLRWLIGSVLTAFSGAALIGGAIVISLQGEIVQVERPQRAVVGSDKGKVSQAAVRKADRLMRREVTGSAARQEFKAPVTLRAGNREVIKSRDFVRISAPLSLTAGTYARAIPPFNALNLFAENESSAVSARDTAPDVADADVSVIKHNLAGLSFAADEPSLNAEEARAQVIASERLAHGFNASATIPQVTRNMLFRSLRQNPANSTTIGYANLTDMPFSDIDVRVIPENVTQLTKQIPLTISTQGQQAHRMDEHFVGAPGNLVLKLLIDEGASTEVARTIVKALNLDNTDKLKDGQSLAVLPTFDPTKANNANPEGEVGHIETPVIGRVILRHGDSIQAIAAITDDGQYVPVFLPQEEMANTSTQNNAADEDLENGPGAALYDSLFETAARHGVPIEIVRALIPLFAADVDLQRRVANGESLELLYSDAESEGAPELLYAALTVEGEIKRLYRFQSPGNGEISFYDPDGRSLQKFLIRKPISEGRLTSSFGMRYHPVLRYAKMHTGIDWAFRVGTPILAAGDGQLAKVGWQSGYGKRIEIQHANGYLTTYSHMSNFARGMKAGDRVKQGQIIGYLGSTGLSTGPHLHYEVMVNGRFVDPLKIKLPRSNELDGADLAEFTHQRDQVKELLMKAQEPG